MDIASFKERYPVFTDDLAITTALNDAIILLSVRLVPNGLMDLATALMAAHILSVPAGVVERAVISVKSDTEQVDFDRNPEPADWLMGSGYGKQLMNLLGISTSIARRYGVINAHHPLAIKFDYRHDFDGSVIGVDNHDKRHT